MIKKIDTKVLAKQLKEAADYLADNKEQGGCYRFNTVEIDDKGINKKMSKSQNTKNEQQKDLCITSEQLTEQWKKGELPSGWYWVKGSRTKEIYAYTAEYLNNMYRPINGESVLEKVPDYAHWQNLRNTADMEHKANNKLIEDVERLEKENKELKKTSQSSKQNSSTAICG